LLLLLLLLPCNNVSVALQEIPFDCNGAKQIGKVSNACNLLCTCAGALDKSLTSATKDKEVARCKDQCAACNKEAESCKPGTGLPKACEEGQKNQWVKQCITTYLKSTSGQRSG
jgi:hypothetical protein